ncbi:sensor histidine kinase [Streptomyces sp. NPDC049099]|uniref:sensor histidine kinase n=1 Tax=Streptomyces sp. NPDC049099 TaxID=3155768 RepID=UPI003428A8AE
MSTTRALLLLKRVPPGVWATLTWCVCAATAYTTRMSDGNPRPVMQCFPPEGMDRQARCRLFLVADPDGTPGGTWFLAAGFVLVLAGGVLLHRRPLAGVALLLAGSAAGTAGLHVARLPFLQFLSADVALFFVAVTRPRRTAVTATAVSLGVMAGCAVAQLLLAGSLDSTGPAVALTAVVLTAVIAWLTGDALRRSREYAERLSAQATASAVMAERLRISRELHDVVAHSIGIIALQAGAAGEVLDTQPARAREALKVIETSGRETLSGLRRMVGALRQAQPRPGVDAASAEPAPLDPVPGLAGLDRLAEVTTAAGVRVAVRRHGRPRPLPQEIDLSAFRIVQEAVTNVVRHARTDSCQVTVDHRDDALVIDVLDDGRGRGAGGATGYGLVGMRERVGLLHGELSAGPRPEGGFRVTARLPLPQEAR